MGEPSAKKGENIIRRPPSAQRLRDFWPEGWHQPGVRKKGAKTNGGAVVGEKSGKWFNADPQGGPTSRDTLPPPEGAVIGATAPEMTQA